VATCIGVLDTSANLRGGGAGFCPGREASCQPGLNFESEGVLAGLSNTITIRSPQADSSRMTGNPEVDRGKTELRFAYAGASQAPS